MNLSLNGLAGIRNRILAVRENSAKEQLRW